MQEDESLFRVWRHKWPGEKSWNAVIENIPRQVQIIQCFYRTVKSTPRREEALRPVISECETQQL